MSPEERLNALAHAHIKTAEAFELLKSMMDGTFVPGEGCTMDEEKVALASFIYSIGEALQGIGIGMLLDER